MLNKEIGDALNSQMNFEMYSANIYMSMATWFDAKNLGGFASWMKVQYSEEMFHYTKLYNFINERGARVLLGAMNAPETEWASPLAAFENALEHERIGETIDRIGLANFLEALDVPVDPNMVNHPRTSSYVRTDDWDVEAEKWFEHKQATSK